MSTVSSGIDISAKFQKLYAEYAKVRAQLPVLKNALIDEREKTTALQGNIREKDQLCRELQVESESLLFRNQQLTKRVEFLQEQLSSATVMTNNVPTAARLFRSPSTSSKHSGKLKQSVSQDQFPSAVVADNAKRVLEEELKRQLLENERLNQQIFDMTRSIDHTAAESGMRIRELEQQLEHLGSELALAKGRQEALTADLKFEKEEACGELSTVRLELTECKRLYEKSELQRTSLDAELADLRHLTADRVLFSDRACPDFNLLDAPVLEEILWTDLRLLLSAFQPSVAQASAHLALYHSYCKQRAELYPRDTTLGECLSESSAKHCKLFQEHADDSRAVDHSFNALVSCVNDGAQESVSSCLSVLLDTYRNYVQFVNGSAVLVQKCMEEECAVDWCNPRLEKSNRAYINEYEKFSIALGGVAASFKCLLSTQSGDVSWSMLVQQLESALQGLSGSVKGLHNQYLEKITHEHQIPIATRRLRTTNECIAAALNSTYKYISEIEDTFRQNYSSIVHCFQQISRLRPEACTWKRHAESYYNSVALTSLSHGPNHQPAGLSSMPRLEANSIGTPCDSVEWKLNVLLQEKHRTLGLLEKENEKLLLESRLLRMRLNQCGHVPEQRSCDTFNESAYTEEYYDGRIAELNSRVQDISSRARFFHTECESLLKMIAVYQKQKDELQSDSKLATLQIKTLKDELETTRKEYEAQLSTLSEHLAVLNQKLTKQMDEIDTLKQTAGSNKGHGKPRLR